MDRGDGQEEVFLKKLALCLNAPWILPLSKIILEKTYF